MEENKTTLFEQIGGRETLKKVHKKFYDDLFAHPGLVVWFEGVNQEHIENQQTDFMQKAMGGENQYAGKTPRSAHQNMFITQELFDLRHDMLANAVREFVKDEDAVAKWLKIDYSFRMAVVKESIDECEKANPSQKILAFDKDGKSLI